ncbi:MAG: LamG domain-containing protein [Phycisphaerae bacterium]|nr:LamG domain-containing protein [Phycisphaerae bacterium]
MRRTGVCLAGLFLVLASAGDVSAGLVAHWKLDETTGTVVSDSSGNGYDGTLVGGVTWVAGMINGALELDGTGYADFGNPAGWPSGKAARTLCGWGKTNSVDAVWKWIAAYGSAGTDLAMFIGLNGTALYGGGYGDDVYVSNFWEVGVWHHICLTYDGTTARLYADAVEVTSAKKNWNLVLSRAHIGQQVNDLSEFWDGMIDDVRLYNRRLTDDHVAVVCAGGTPDFTKAESPNPVNGAIGVSTALLQWTKGEGAAKHNVYLGTSRDLTEDNRVASKIGNVFYFHAGGLVGGTTYYWRVDEIETDGVTIHTGDVWSFVAQADVAYYPIPKDGENNVQPDAMLTWAPGKSALGHHLYFGGDLDAVTQGTSEADQGTLDAATTSFSTGTLDPLTSYYWRVDESKTGNVVLAGPVWTFTTVLPIDDFESYNDDDNRIFDSWVDGYVNGTGATVGNWESPFAELTIVHDANQAMPLDYNNVDSPYYSEAEYEFGSAQDWTVDDVNTLILYVRGKMGNAQVPLYVRIIDSSNKTALVVHPDAAIATSTKWVEWQIPLADFTNVSLSRVKKLYIGLGDSMNPTAGGTGRMYVDSIGLAK